MPRSDKSSRPATTGLLVLDKPLGPSSMQAIAAVRGKARGAKTGHAGTLDPLATGVLLVALGRATKIIDRLMDTTKQYRTVIDLSAFTTTDDREGERQEVAVQTPPTRTHVERAAAVFRGEIDQRPPAFSAMKVGGQRAYRIARCGGAVEIPSRRVVVHDVQLLAYDWPMAEVLLHTGKGFYVRSFARDLGRSLGTGGHCAALRRTAVGPFTEAMAVALDDVPEPLTEADLLPVDEVLAMVGSEHEHGGSGAPAWARA